MSVVWLVVGLGNPGKQYAATRHNIGFLAVDALAEHYRANAWTKKFQAELCEVKGGGDIPRLFFLKPQTYMNLSGESVQAAAHFYKIPPERIIVLHDELALPYGKLRVKRGGGAGGHNGLKSIDAHLGQEYWRVRIGISHPGDKDQVTDYVLGKFSAEERELQEAMIKAIAQYFLLLLNEDDSSFMNKVALSVA